MNPSFVEGKAKEIISDAIGSDSEKWGVYIKDISSGLEIKHNADAQFSSASLIKLPVLVSTMMAVAEGILNLKLKFVVDNRFATEEEKSGSGIILHLSSPIELTLYDLCYFMIVVSDNYATDLVIDILGMERINTTLKEIGLKQTCLNNKLSRHTKLAGKI